MVLYFPILSSGGNPRASPEETNAPASISLLLILLTRGRSPTRPFPQCATESMCTYSRCVCVCVCVCIRGLCVCSAGGLALHGHLMCGRVKDACMHAGVCIKGCACSFPVHAKSPSECTYVSLPICVCACVYVFLMLYHSDFSVMAPIGCRLSNLMHQL